MNNTIVTQEQAASLENHGARAVSGHCTPKPAEHWETAYMESIIPDHRCFALADYMENRGQELRLDRKTYADLAKRGWTRADVNRTISKMAMNDQLIECAWDDGVVVFRLLAEVGGVHADGVDAL